MKAQELRIGNWVEHDGSLGEVEDIQKNDIGSFFDGVYFNCYIKDLEPIPLTEDWLVKFGFVKEDDFGKIEFQFNPLVLYKQDKIYWSDILWDSLEIKHVHQLQNLYFALTGEEL